MFICKIGIEWIARFICLNLQGSINQKLGSVDWTSCKLIFCRFFQHSPRLVCRHGKTGQNFLTRPTPDFFDPKQKRVDPWPDTCFLRVNPTRLVTRPEPKPFFKNFFVLVKKIVKLRQYWFNCLLWVLRKQLIHLHNCMQINWKINGWAFCNE